VQRMRVFPGIWILGWMFVTATAALAAPAAPPELPRFTTEDVEVERIFELADQRLAVMPAVAAAKWQTKAPIYDPPRESAVIQRAADLGAPMGLAGDPLKHLFELQARLAREVQTGLHEEWKAHGFSYAEPVTTLAALRPRLDELTTEILRAVYLAVPVLKREDFETRYADRAQKDLQTKGWTDQNRHELLAVLHSVQLTPVPALQRIEASHILRIGTTGDYAPFSVENVGTLSGSDIDKAEMLAQVHLHVRPVYIHTTWATMSDDLSQGAFDLAIGGVSVSPAREAIGVFSKPYASSGKTILARCDDQKKFRKGLAAVDKPTVRVIVNPGGTNEQYVRANLHRARILVFPDNRAIFGELVAGHADVMITDDVEADYQAKYRPNLCRAFPGTFTHSDKAIFMPRDPELVALVNHLLDSGRLDGAPVYTP
jgi:cyclohexadienyl dehydratase